MVPASRLENEPRRHRLPTGLDSLDALLAGGWPAAALSEIAGKRSAGRTSVLYASLAAAQARTQAVALVDAAGVFDPRSAEAAGLVLSRLLWIHAAGRTVLQAAELLVAAGGFGLVALDVGERPARVPDASWLRLRHAAARHGTAVLVAAPWRIVGATAAAAVVMHGPMPRFEAAGRPLLVALETRATVERISGAAPSPDNQQLLRFAAPGAEAAATPTTPVTAAPATAAAHIAETAAPAIAETNTQTFVRVPAVAVSSRPLSESTTAWPLPR